MRSTASGPAGPPASLMLLHGAGSGPWIFADWPPAFPGIEVRAVDLQRDLDAGTATMTAYAAVVTAEAARLRRPMALCGWSMGGLVALIAAPVVQPHSVILLEPSAPAEVQGFYPETPMTLGSFDPEVVYGAFPPGWRARPESLLARAERKRGISVPAIPCASLVVHGDTLPPERGRLVAAHYGSEAAYFPGLTHDDLIVDPRIRTVIANFLGVPA